MDFELKHLGQTLAVGGFAIYAVVFLVRICRAGWLPRVLDASDGKLQLQHAAVYLALTFATGALLEDVSKACATEHNSISLPFLDRVIDKENKLRFRSLFSASTFGNNKIEAEALPILCELQHVPAYPGAMQPYFSEIAKYVPVEESCLQPDKPGGFRIGTEVDVKRFLHAVDGVYYDAKNLVYRETTYYQELSDRSERLDFTRSLTLLCYIFFFTYLLFALLATIRITTRFLKIDKRERRTVLILSLLYAAGIWLAGTAYRSEAIAYDQRVFGYYVSLRTLPKSSPAREH